MPPDCPASVRLPRVSLTTANRFFDLSLTKYSTAVRLFPIAFFMCYLTFTVILFAVGPWHWPVQDGTKLYTFLAFAHLALFGGYCTAVFRTPRAHAQPFPLQKLIAWTIIVNGVLLLPTFTFRTGSMLPDLAKALADPGRAYANSLAIRESDTPIIEYLRLVAGPFTALFLPLVVFYWRFIRASHRLLALAVILGTIALFVAMGTNKAIADTVLLLPWLVLAAHFAGVIRLSFKKVIISTLAATLCFAAFLSFFALAMSTRSGSAAFFGYFPAAGIRADSDNFLIQDAPPLVKIGVLGLDSYLTQGYYALSLSLDKPFTPMFGIGNSFFLTRQAVRLTGKEEIADLSYPAKIEREDGWDAFGLWSSIYPWIASDVSFPGTILVVFLIGRLFALSWLDTLEGTNPFAVALFSQFVIMLFYFPANNQLLQTGEGLTGFVGISLLWAYLRPHPRNVAVTRVVNREARLP